MHLTRQIALAAVTVAAVVLGTGPAAFAASYGGPDANLITGTETSPHDTQAGASLATNGTSVVAGYDDGREATANYSGMSYSSDGGQTWTRLTPSPFATGHGTSYGEVAVAWDAKASLYLAVALATGCGGQGLGLWTSADGQTWGAGACVHNGTSDDLSHIAVDNTASSPYYGRVYVIWNDFNSSGSLSITRSDDLSTWSLPVVLVPGTSFTRALQVLPERSGRIDVVGDFENGGAHNLATHQLFVSTDGGATFATPSTIVTNVAAPGSTTCGYFAAMAGSPTVWRYQGWGQLALASDGTLGYAYSVLGSGGDEGNIAFTRSVDHGATWSAPVQLNADLTTRAQWQPQLAAVGDEFFAQWYDRRNTSNYDYEIRGRLSTDAGATWGVDQPVSDGTIPYPSQNDTSLQTCFYGFGDFSATVGGGIVTTWTDGRVAVSGTQQEDIFSDMPVRSAAVAPPSGTTPPTSGDRVPPTIRALFKRRQDLAMWLKNKAKLKFSLSEAGAIAVRASKASTAAASADVELAMVPTRSAQAALIAKGSARTSGPGKVRVAMRLTKQGKFMLRRVRRSVTLLLDVSATDTAGNRAGLKRKVTLVRGHR